MHHVIHRFRESEEASRVNSLTPLQALKSTAVTHSAYIPRFLPDGGDALVVAKGNLLEVWRGTEEGLVEEDPGRTEVWGMVVGMEWVGGEVSSVRNPESAMCEGSGQGCGAVGVRHGMNLFGITIGVTRLGIRYQRSPIPKRTLWFLYLSEDGRI